MKKLIFIVILIVAGISGFEYWQKYEGKLSQVKNDLAQGINLAQQNHEVFTPGGIRAGIESSRSVLTASGTIAETNKQRLAAGLPALKENTKLSQAAAIKVKDMFAGQYFEHISPIGTGPGDLANQVSYAYISVGENLALGNYKDDQVLVDAWMNSPGHRANILNTKFTEIGVYVLRGTYEGKSTWLAVQEFGRPAADCPTVSEFLKTQIDLGKIEAEKLQQQVNGLKAQLDGMPEPQSKKEVEEYNQKVAEYNAVVKIFNNLIDRQKSLVSQYNLEVKAFNECIAR